MDCGIVNVEKASSGRFHFMATIINFNLKAVLIFLKDMKICITYSYYCASFGNDSLRRFIHLLFVPSSVQKINIFIRDPINEK
jgi:hypothetical protein